MSRIIFEGWQCWVGHSHGLRVPGCVRCGLALSDLTEAERKSPIRVLKPFVAKMDETDKIVIITVCILILAACLHGDCIMVIWAD